ncbi:hypothetical protein [Ralstonia mojiangensis]|uniref:hypothetical protein n=1 Tax=Ralstonia mojiangensis TaxID=2953895 RepID=UPI0021B36C25|nr:hypothetical protein [Ralstonia mojiangensis]
MIDVELPSIAFSLIAARLSNPRHAGNKKPATLYASRVFFPGIAHQTLPVTWWPKGYRTTP